eukprot:TRINITY_DN1284_c0_g2_i3.p1 TRINITY_DN1284_c0_g2~~TRINITY_DN1284_c0_g2_i3.p1  ORF type:complete len:403 (+),score=98.39 TRINITY_DN1284_c0_g2_i3:24-1211(+)
MSARKRNKDGGGAAIVGGRLRDIRPGITLDELERCFTVTQIRQWCKGKPVVVHGTKRDVVARVLAYLNSGGAAGAPVAVTVPAAAAAAATAPHALPDGGGKRASGSDDDRPPKKRRLHGVGADSGAGAAGACAGVGGAGSGGSSGSGRSGGEEEDVGEEDLAESEGWRNDFCIERDKETEGMLMEITALRRQLSSKDKKILELEQRIRVLEAQRTSSAQVSVTSQAAPLSVSPAPAPAPTQAPTTAAPSLIPTTLAAAPAAASIPTPAPAPAPATTPPVALAVMPEVKQDAQPQALSQLLQPLLAQLPLACAPASYKAAPQGKALPSKKRKPDQHSGDHTPRPSPHKLRVAHHFQSSTMRSRRMARTRRSPNNQKRTPPPWPAHRALARPLCLRP